jgi:hypothetical protein
MGAHHELKLIIAICKLIAEIVNRIFNRRR